MLPKPDQINQIIVLLNIYHGKKKPSEIAREMNITLQGVIYHMKNLRRDGLIDEENRITKEGFDFLYRQLSDMREFITSNIQDLDSLMVWEAIAAENIIAGSTVYLRMKDGYLHAFLSGGGATGRAVNDSQAGGLVGITNLSGMIDVNFGKLSIIVIPDSIDGGIGEKLKKATEDLSPALFAAMGEAGYVALKGIGVEPDIEYSALQAAFEACVRGRNVILVTSRRRLHYSMAEIPQLENRYNPVKANITDLS